MQHPIAKSRPEALTRTNLVLAAVRSRIPPDRVKDDVDWIFYVWQLNRVTRYAQENTGGRWDIENAQRKLAESVDPTRLPNVAGHSWHTGIICLEIAQRHFPEVDAHRAGILGLKHDMMELITGDESPIDAHGKSLGSHVYAPDKILAKDEAERAAIAWYLDRFFPGEGRDREERDLTEALRCQTLEAMFVKAIDRMVPTVEMLGFMQRGYVDGHLCQCITHMYSTLSHFPPLLPYYVEMEERMITKTAEWRKVPDADVRARMTAETDYAEMALTRDEIKKRLEAAP